MGRIDRIEVENFKSYAGIQQLGPFKDFSAIIGPNGAGKSNVMDSICFVLGLNAKSIRAGNMKDLIFRAEGQPVTAKHAAVRLVYELSENEIPNMAAGTQIVFERTVVSSGATTFKVSGHEVSSQDYADSLYELGIDVKTRNFLVFQGDVQTLADKDPREMLNYFESFSGSSSLKPAYDEAQQELEESRSEFNIKSNNRRLLQVERRQLRQQKEEGERYLNFQKNLETERTKKLLFQLYCVWSDLNTSQKHHEAALSTLGKESSALEELNSELKQLARTLAQNQQRKGKLSSTLLQRQRASRAAEERLLSLQSEMSSHRNRLVVLGKEETRCENALVAARDELNSLLSDLEALSSGLEAAQASSLTTLEGSNLSAAATTEFLKLHATFRRQCSDLRLRLDQGQREQEALQAELGRLRASRGAAQARQSQVQEQLNVLLSRIAGLQHSLAKGETQKQQQQVALQQQQEQLSRALQRREQLSRELREVEASLDEAGAAKAASEQEQRASSAVALLRARLGSSVRGRLFELVAPLQRAHGQALAVVLGRFAEAVVVETETVALECVRILRSERLKPMLFLPLAALRVDPIAPHIEALVAASVSFPAEYTDGSVVQTAHNSRRNSQTASSGVVKKKVLLARQLFHCDADIQRAVDFAAGSTLVTETLEDAMYLKFVHIPSLIAQNQNQRDADEDDDYSSSPLRCKLVTLGGEVVAKNGNISGGSTANVPGGRYGAQKASAASTDMKWESRQLQGLQERRLSLLQEEEQLRRRLARHDVFGGTAEPGSDASDSTESVYALVKHHEGVLADLQARQTQQQQALAAAQQALQQLKAESQPLEDEIRSMDADIAAQERRLAEADSKLAALKQEQAQRRGEAFGSFCKQHSLDETALDRLEKAESLTQGAHGNKAVDALKERLSRLGSSRDFQTTKVGELEAALAKTKEQQAEVVASIKKLESEIGTVEHSEGVSTEVEAARQEILSLEQDIAATEALLAEAEARRTTLQTARDTLLGRQNAAKKAVSAFELELEALRARRHALLVASKTDNIALPLKGASTSRRGGKEKKNEADDDDSSNTNESLQDLLKEDSSISSPHFSQADNAAVLEDEEFVRRIDFDVLSPSLKRIVGPLVDQLEEDAEEEENDSDEEDMKKRRPRRSVGAPTTASAGGDGNSTSSRAEVEKELTATILRLQRELEGMSPNLKALERFEEVEARFSAATAEFEALRQKVVAAEKKFHEVKAERIRVFRGVFGRVRAAIGRVYAELTGGDGSASLELVGDEETLFDTVSTTVSVSAAGNSEAENAGNSSSKPNVGTTLTAGQRAQTGIRFSAIPPAKRFREIKNLSGGEKTVAALALLFALQTVAPAPFFIMDEVDAALDNVNVLRVARYVRSRALNGDLQFIVISLKDKFFDKANCAIGIFKDSRNFCSRTLSIDLSKYDEDGNDAQSVRQSVSSDFADNVVDTPDSFVSAIPGSPSSRISAI